MSSYQMYLGLIDTGGAEMTPGMRQLVVFDQNPGGIQSNTYPITFSNIVGTVAAIALYEDPWAVIPVMLTPVATQLTISAGSGDGVNIPAGAIRRAGLPTVGRGVVAKVAKVATTYEVWAEARAVIDLPINPQEVWDAAFLAGYELAKALLQGATHE